jgi:hypothetical protein
LLKSEEKLSKWWGDYDIPLNGAARWTIGSFVLEISRADKEWRAAILRPQSDTGTAGVLLSLPSGGELARSRGERYCFNSTSERLRLLPALADRSVVTRPIAPFHVQGNQETTIFASTPLWMVICVNEALVKMVEFPILRPSDTWFGPSSIEGELCYASRTNCYMSPDEVPRRPHRAITPITIVNRSKNDLPLDRVNIPVRNLSLFAAPDHNLWTDQIILERKEDEREVDLKIKEGPPLVAEGAQRLSGPRERLDRNFVARAFGTLFG